MVPDMRCDLWKPGADKARSQMEPRLMVTRGRWWLAFTMRFLGWWVGLAGVIAGAEPTLRLDVDARDLPRRLLHSRMDIPCRPGKLALWYPKWIPGTHGASGPVETVAGLRLEASDGRALAWRRDDTEPFRIECDVPSGVQSIMVRLDTICNAPAVHAGGYLSYGNTSIGIINWNTCLLYPEGFSSDDIRVRSALDLPKSWHYATVLETESAQAGRLAFKPVSLTELVDSPVVAGEHLRAIALDAGGGPPAFFHVASEVTSALQLGPEVIGSWCATRQSQTFWPRS
jgi:hypothetical protein